MKKTGVFGNSLIWFGAAVSIAEIQAGAIFASLGTVKAILAILLGHIIGGTLMYFAGLIGGKTKKSAMDTVKISFGKKGGILFSALNVLQLVGWTAVMINTGALSASKLGILNPALWSVIIGALIILWVVIDIKHLEKLNVPSILALFILSVILGTVVFSKNGTALTSDSISFGAALEMSIAMPLSWLPLISDYTMNAKDPKKTCFVSAAVYNVVSVFMYIIGMYAAAFSGESGVAEIMLTAGMGVCGLLIVILSTVTTTYLDVYSAGVSIKSIWAGFPAKASAVCVCIIGIILSVIAPTHSFEAFLYFIGSVFAPMTAILLTDYFILGKKETDREINIRNIILWALGFIIYRLLMKTDIVIGSTVLTYILTSVLCIIFSKKGEKKC